MALTSARQILNKKVLDGGSSADVQELKVEFAALSASVLTIGEKVENATTYSTTEKIVGKWIDGSDIYEKTFHNSETILLTASDWTNGISFVDASNIDLLIDGEAIRTIGATSVYGYLQYAITAATGAFNIFNARNLAVEIDTITLRYTKKAAAESKKTTRKSTK